ncbi:Transposon Ty3-I Gag-Pol polyprotein [Thelohanellus kitauei]|uniref:Transposon Ty3-I Gag-Pol polyprotein n=1 Tax=Thelohanellus kitauei TaxID=669202 RepID=A0A0C2J1S5_THEKT|nr:Transposon Ty3-I Gag-Pol polyprotein [Thelohanellus kitauei]
MNDAQQNYAQFPIEALSIIFTLEKFYKYLYGREFVIVMDHESLISLFSPNKGIPVMAVNRLPRWVHLLSQYDYQIEYRQTTKHGNGDFLSRLPVSSGRKFDSTGRIDDLTAICQIHQISKSLNASNMERMQEATSHDQVLANVRDYIEQGCPQNIMKEIKDIGDSLSVMNGCVFYGNRLVIPKSCKAKYLKFFISGISGSNE